MQLRSMTIEDYDRVRDLWMKIKGFAIRSIDDSEEGISKFLSRNPGLSVAAVEEDRIIGAILCGHDGRRGCFYHVCVDPEFRRKGIGKAMTAFCTEKLKEEGINKVDLIAFTTNGMGNAFWRNAGWTERKDLNYYDLTLNEDNQIRVNK